MAAILEVKADAAQLHRLANLIGAAGKNANVAIARAVNHTGDKAKTQMLRALTVQTGLQRKTIVKALVVTKAGQGTLTYSIRSSGGNVSLKYFGARETSQGVSAAPLGVRSIYAGTFMKAGWWPHRVRKPGWHGQVFARAPGAVRGQASDFVKQKSGVYIPNEMVTGATAQAFRDAAERDLPDRLVHELGRMIGG